MSVDILLRHGLVSPEQIAAAHTLRQREGGVPSIGECLVSIGAIDEEALLEFYHKRLMIPRLDDARLEAVSAKVLGLVPADMAVEFRIVPFDVDADGSVSVAMSEPTNNHAVDEVAFFTDRFVIRSVARLGTVRRALERFYQARLPALKIAIKRDPDPPRVRAATSTPLPPTRVPLQQPEGEPVLLLTRVKRIDETPLPAHAPPPPDLGLISDFDDEPDMQVELESDDVEAAPILLTKPKAPTERPRRERHDTLPGLGSSTAGDPPLGGLRDARSRDEVAALLLDYVGTLAGRAILFVVKKSLLVGHDARGGQIDPIAVKELAINIEAASIFRDVVASRLPYRGPLPMSSTNRAFALAIGGVVTEIVLMPIAVRERIIAVLYADSVEGVLPEAALHAATREAGLAYERIILDAKR